MSNTSLKDRAIGLRRDRAVLWQEVTAALPGTSVAVVAVLPNGGAEVVQSAGAGITQSSDTALSLLTELTWQTIGIGRPLVWPRESAGQPKDESLLADAFGLMEIGQAIVFPLRSFALPGYPAAIHIHRLADQARLGEREIAHIQAAVDRFNQLAETDSPQVFSLNSALAPATEAEAWSRLNPQLRAGLVEAAKQFLAKVSDRQPSQTDRIATPDATGQMRPVRFAAYHHHPIAGNQSTVILFLQPAIEAWVSLEAADFLPEADFGRFLPALRYIHEHARQGPPLASIARSVHLSPFHFHRKFAEVFGLTPKQFLLDCQIADAQSFLLKGDLELSAVARSCGFAHQSHFTSRFKQATGLTPTRWRKLMQRPN